MTKTSPWTPIATAAAAAILVVWFAIAVWIGVSGIASNPEGSALAPITLTVLVPVAIFLAAYRLLPAFRHFVLAQDLRLLTMVQAWRVVGLGFLLLYAHGTLPALFAFPAGVGDVLIGLAAPWVVLRMERDPAFVTGGGLARYHLLGLLDFVVAVGTAGLSAGALPIFAAGGTSWAMQVWPLNLFPSFFVPLFIITHLTVLLQLRQMRRAAALRPATA